VAPPPSAVVLKFLMSIISIDQWQDFAFPITAMTRDLGDIVQNLNVMDRSVGPNQARFWLDWVRSPRLRFAFCGSGTLACEPRLSGGYPPYSTHPRLAQVSGARRFG
jgi:hypothetical protein